MSNETRIAVTATDVLILRQSVWSGAIAVIHNERKVGELPWKGGSFTAIVGGKRVDIRNRFVERKRKEFLPGMEYSNFTQITIWLDGRLHNSFEWHGPPV